MIDLEQSIPEATATVCQKSSMVVTQLTNGNILLGDEPWTSGSTGKLFNILYMLLFQKFVSASNMYYILYSNWSIIRGFGGNFYR